MKRGSCRSEGLVVGEHVPDRFGESAGEVDLGDLGSALAAEAALGVLVAPGVVGVFARVERGLEQIGRRASTAPDCRTRGNSPVERHSLGGGAKRPLSPISEAIV